MPDTITGTINHIRLVINAIAEGRVEARTLQGMTDEQVESYVTRLQGEAHDAVDEGYAMHETSPE